MCLKCEKANSGKQCYEKILPNLGESTSHVNPDLPTYVDAAEIDIAKAAGTSPLENCFYSSIPHIKTIVYF